MKNNHTAEKHFIFNFVITILTILFFYYPSVIIHEGGHIAIALLMGGNIEFSSLTVAMYDGPGVLFVSMAGIYAGLMVLFLMYRLTKGHKETIVHNGIKKDYFGVSKYWFLRGIIYGYAFRLYSDYPTVDMDGLGIAGLTMYVIFAILVAYIIIRTLAFGIVDKVFWEEQNA